MEIRWNRKRVKRERERIGEEIKEEKDRKIIKEKGKRKKKNDGK